MSIKSHANKTEQAAPAPVLKSEDHILLFEFSDNSLEKILKAISIVDGFAGSKASRVQFEIPVSINPSDTVDIASFTGDLKRSFNRRPPFANMKFQVLQQGTAIKQMKPAK